MKLQIIAKELHYRLIEDFGLKNDPETNARVRIIIIEAMQKYKVETKDAKQ